MSVLTESQTQATPFVINCFMTIFRQITSTLKEEISGTDAELDSNKLERAHLNFLTSLVRHDSGSVLIAKGFSPSMDHHSGSYRVENIASLQEVMGDVCARASVSRDPRSQALAFTFFGEAAQNYCSVTNGGTKVPGLEQYFYEHVVKLCFEIPARSDFNFQAGESQSVSQRTSDCQSFSDALIDPRRDGYVFETSVYCSW